MAVRLCYTAARPRSGQFPGLAILGNWARPWHSLRASECHRFSSMKRWYLQGYFPVEGEYARWRSACTYAGMYIQIYMLIYRASFLRARLFLQPLPLPGKHIKERREPHRTARWPSRPRCSLSACQHDPAVIRFRQWLASWRWFDNTLPVSKDKTR